MILIKLKKREVGVQEEINCNLENRDSGLLLLKLFWKTGIVGCFC